jgi:DNA-binding response OmpR family regulator
MNPKILIVEDEPNILIPLRFLMEQNHYTVQDAQKGDQVIAAMEGFLPDLILLDIMLPQMNGFEICQAIRGRPEWRSIKIIILSAKGSDMDIAKGMALGADAYITKPFSNAELVECVKNLLNK